MGLPVEVNNLMLGSLGGYTVGRSLRFRNSGTPSSTGGLDRTFGTGSGNQTTWTYSAWIKLGRTSFRHDLLYATTGGANQLFGFNINSSGQFSFDGNNGGGGQTVALSNDVFRDPSAWYHFVVRLDTNNATQANRLLVYVNGRQITSWATTPTPASGATYYINGNNYAHQINRTYVTNNGYMTAGEYYIAEINFIDNQALGPTSFGAFDTNGVWQPKKYTGTYGTNGFYLNFSDNSAATAAAIGKDSSGNGNNWTPNNISLTAGTTYDSMIDSPTNAAGTSTGIGNYAVMNPLSKSSAYSISNGNLTVTCGANGNASSTIGMSSGKWYWEAVVTNFVSVSLGLGSYQLPNNVWPGNSPYGWAFNGNGYIYNNGGFGTNYGSYAVNDVIGVAFDADNGKLYFAKNGTWLNSGVPESGTGAMVTGLTNGPYFAFVSDGTSSGTVWNVNFGQRPFTYTPPSGFKALNTYNLPAASISNGANHFAATTYTGNGDASQTRVISNGNFQPDFVWVKSRSVANSHALEDSVRGAGNILRSELTASEMTGRTDILNGFSSTGFIVGGDAISNANGTTYVGWQWKAGGTGVTNTSGSITSTVSANTTAGFSVVTYTGNGTISATVGHGLGVAPNMIIVKLRSAVGGSWQTYHSSIGATGTVYLDLTSAVATSSGFWNNTAPTSSVFSIGNSGSSNVSAATHVAYCFSAVRGYSAFGSYTGNGSADGPFIYTGFRPRFVMVKRTDNIGYWYIWDTSRNTVNVVGEELYPNSSSAGATFSSLDILSNGFKIRSTAPDYNNSGGTVIYAAFAENPFNSSRAR